MDPLTNETAASGNLSDRLFDALRHQRAYLAIYQHYQEARPRPDFAALLDTLNMNAQEMIEILAGALRRSGESPVTADLPERLLQQGLERRGTLSRLQFILVGLQNSNTYYVAQRARGHPEGSQDLWDELLILTEDSTRRVKGLLQEIGHEEPVREGEAGDKKEDR